MDSGVLIVFFLICLAVAVGMGAILGAETGRSEKERQAIERGYALHCPTTGEFAWKGECDQ